MPKISWDISPPSATHGKLPLSSPTSRGPPTTAPREHITAVAKMLGSLRDHSPRHPQ